MNPLAVVDASVAVKWVLDEEFSDLADALYAHSAERREPLIAPLLFPNEVCNAVYQRIRRGQLTEAQADDAFNRFGQFEVDLVTLSGLLDDAYAFAKENRLQAIYDSLYVVLAFRLDLELWTYDKRLLNAVRTFAPWVRWIGDYRRT